MGTVLVAVLAAGALGGNQGDLAIGRQLGIQLMAAVGVVVYTVLVSYGILEVADATIGLRVGAPDEDQGLDVVRHEEAGYRF